MSLNERLMLDLKVAMKTGNVVAKDTLRLLRSAIKYAEIEQGHVLSDQEILTVLGKQAKQRRESITEFSRAGRTDLVEKELRELEIVERYLPQQLTEDEIRARAEMVIAELGVSDVKGMAQVMQRLMSELKGRVDGKIANKVVRTLLGQ
jgi:uncharacterized protein